MKKIFIVLLVALVAVTSVFANAAAETSAKKTITIGAESWEINKIFLEHAAEEFMAKHPDVTVEIVTIADQAKLSNYLLDWSKGSTDVDLVFLDGGTFAKEYAAKGLIYDFDKDLNFFKDFSKDLFTPGALDTGKLYEGKQIAIPAIYEVYGISVNKTMFKEAGLLDANGNPLPINSWDDFYKFAEKLTKKDANGNVTQVGGSIQFGNNLDAILGVAILAEFGDVFAADGKTYNVDNAYMKHVIELWQKGVQNGYFSTSTFTNNAGGRTGFKAGQIAMCYESAGRWMEAIETVGKENLALLRVPGAACATNCFGCQMVIPKASKNAELTCQFIKECVYGEYCQTNAFNQYGKMSVIKKHFDKALAETPLWASIEDSINNAQNIEKYEQQQKFLEGLCQIFQAGLVDPKTSADQIVKQIVDLTKTIK